MSDLTNFDPVAVGEQIAALETEAQKDITAAKAVYEPEAALFTSRSEAIAAKLWDVAQHHPEHLDEVCRIAGIGRSRRDDLLRVGGGRKAMGELNRENAVRQANFKARKKARKLAAAEAAKDVTVTTSKVTGKAPAQPKAIKGKSAAKPKPIKSSTALAEIDAFTKHWFPLLKRHDLTKAEKLILKRIGQARVLNHW